MKWWGKNVKTKREKWMSRVVSFSQKKPWKLTCKKSRLNWLLNWIHDFVSIINYQIGFFNSAVIDLPKKCDSFRRNPSAHNDCIVVPKKKPFNSGMLRPTLGSICSNFAQWLITFCNISSHNIDHQEFKEKLEIKSNQRLNGLNAFRWRNKNKFEILIVKMVFVPRWHFGELNRTLKQWSRKCLNLKCTMKYWRWLS